MGHVIVSVIVIGILLLLALAFVRLLLSMVGLGPWACSKGWHRYRDFPLHTSVGLTSRTTTYLAVASQRIHQCRTCGAYSPPEGEVVHEQWIRGHLKAVGAGVFTDPKMQVDREAARAIGAALAASAAAAPPPRPQKPEKRSPQWMVVIGSGVIVQKLGIWVCIAGGILGMGYVVGGLTSKDSRDEPGQMILTGLGLWALVFFVAKLMDAGMSRHIDRSLAAEAKRDPEGYYRRTMELARERGLDVPESVTPESLAEVARSRSNDE